MTFTITSARQESCTININNFPRRTKSGRVAIGAAQPRRAEHVAAGLVARSRPLQRRVPLRAHAATRVEIRTKGRSVAESYDDRRMSRCDENLCDRSDLR